MGQGSQARLPLVTASLVSPQFGRTKQLTPIQYQELCERRAQGVLIKTLMKDYNLSKASVYRYLNEAKTIKIETLT